MISKKMRNISMVCLSLVLALSLAFGLSSFSLKKADAVAAGTYTFDTSESYNQSYAYRLAGDADNPIYFVSRGSINKSNNYGIRMYRTGIFLYLSQKSTISVLYCSDSTSSRTTTIKPYKIDELHYNLISNASTASSTQVDAYLVNDADSATKTYFAGNDAGVVTTKTSDNLKKLIVGETSSNLITSAGSGVSITSAAKDSTGVSYDLNSSNSDNSFDAGYYLLYGDSTGGSVGIKSITITSAVTYTYTINSVEGLDGTYSTVVNGTAADAKLPSKVEGTYTSDDPSDASGTVEVDVDWTLDTSSAGEVTATGTLTAPEGYILADGLSQITATVTVSNPKSYTVVYNNTEIADATVSENGAISLPTLENTVEKYFIGWTNVEGGTTVLDSLKAEGENLTINLYPIWGDVVSISGFEPVAVTINFDETATLPTTVKGIEGGEFSVEWDEYTIEDIGVTNVSGTVSNNSVEYNLTTTVATAEITVNAVVVEQLEVSCVIKGNDFTVLPATVGGYEVDEWGDYSNGVVMGTLVPVTGYDVSAGVVANCTLVSENAIVVDFSTVSSLDDAKTLATSNGLTLSNDWTFENSALKSKNDSLSFKTNYNANLIITVKSSKVVTASLTNTASYDKTLTTVANVSTDYTSYNVAADTYTLTIDGMKDASFYVERIIIDEFKQIDGYTIIGFNSNNTIVNEGGYDAVVYAKAKYLGVSFRKSAEDPAVRFGYVVNIVDASENALNGLNLNASAVFNVANLTKGSSANVNFDTLSIAYNENKGGYLANLAITGIDSAKAQNALNIDMTITINGVSITAESDATEADTIVSKAQTLYDKGQLTDAQAAIYGVVLNG